MKGQVRALLSAMITLLLTESADGDGSNVLHADLAIQFVCKAKDAKTLEDQIEGFLGEQGFKILNQARLQREHAYFFSRLNIIGLDDRGHIVEFDALPRPQERYAARIVTQPPTGRAVDLETALKDFVVGDLACSMRQESRQENGAEAIPLYEAELRRIKGLFDQADQLSKPEI